MHVPSLKLLSLVKRDMSVWRQMGAPLAGIILFYTENQPHVHVLERRSMLLIKSGWVPF